MRLLALAILLAGPASAATWLPATMTAETMGSCGSGAVVVGDGCSPIVVGPEHEARLDPFGQYRPGGINSQDTDWLRLRFTSDRDFYAVEFTIADLHDQRFSFGRIVGQNGEQHDFARGPNGNEHTIRFTLPDGAMAFYADVLTAVNDGHTSYGARVCVPREG